MKNRKAYFILLIAFVFSYSKAYSIFTDSINSIKPAKHYFSNTFFVDFYSPQKRIINSENIISQRLAVYDFNQFVAGFNLPVFTKDFYKNDSTRISNIHLLFTGGFTNFNLRFQGISQHTFIKSNLGLRAIYNNGKKSIFFIELSPFITEDLGFKATRTLQLSSTFLYNVAVTEKFSFRVGFTRSFLFGNLFNLPYIGFRFGKLSKTNLSIQFPRNISLNIPFGNHFRTSIYFKPQGGFYTFNNNDSLQLGVVTEHQKMYFGRSEFLGGIKIDYLPIKNFNLYFGGGVTVNNKIEFFPASKKNIFFAYNDYYLQPLKNSIFINIGCVVRFGKSKSAYNNIMMNEAKDLNNNIDPSDNNIGLTNGNIVPQSKKINNINTDEILDLIETQDLN